MITLSALTLMIGLTTVWDGVYTAEQATRGKEAYEFSCAACHDEDLSGGTAKPLIGAPFFRSWGEDTLNSLLDMVRERMPRRAPRSLSDSKYLDIVAYILQQNEYPAGTQELTLAAAPSILVVGKNGPAPVPNLVLVRVVGCLANGAAQGSWVLTRSSEPVRTRTPTPSKDDERLKSETAPLVDHEFDLMDAYAAPEGHAGQKIEVKGILMRGTRDRLNFSSMQVIAASCAP